MRLSTDTFLKITYALLVVLALGTGCGWSDKSRQGETNMETKKVQGQYVKVNGLNMYYEVHGSGEPLILLHGGVGASEMFGPLLPILSEKRQVITVDLQAHGRTADIDRPLSFELMADDIAALIEYLGLMQADLMGYSLGGGVALQTTIRHPELVRKLVVVSAPFERDGLYPEVLATMDQMGPSTADFMPHSPLYQLYPDVDWPMLFTKLGDLLRQDYDWSKDVAEITTLTMIVFADADAVRASHIIEFYGLLGGGQRDAGLDGSGRPINRLAILPGLTHYNILVSPALGAIVIEFLELPAVEARTGDNYGPRNK
jgi:pimeloyl-ACP methyl ester carboxylesterase